MKGLGRGFESLIPTDLIDEEFDPTAKEDKQESKLKEIKITDIIRDEDQPRREFSEEALNALASSIKEHGVLQPIVVTKEDGKYKIVAGERRWRSANLAGLEKIPAIVRTLDSQNRLELAGFCQANHGRSQTHRRRDASADCSRRSYNQESPA